VYPIKSIGDGTPHLTEAVDPARVS